MAKRSAKSTEAITHAMRDDSRGGSTTSLRDKLQEDMHKQLNVVFGDDRILTHEEAMARLGGIAFPSLCLRYLWYNEAFPVGRLITLCGQYRSCKTALAFEMARWILTYQGYGLYFDVEHKDAPGLRASILRNDPTMVKYLEPVDCAIQEQWQGGISHMTDKLIKQPEPWDTMGIGIVDSVAAAKPRSESDKFLKDKGGAGARGYASIALINGDWVGHAAHRIAKAPFVCLLIQHSSEQPVEGIPGATKVTHKGGGEIGFAKTSSLEMRRVKDLKESASGAGGMDIAITCSKNAIGPSNRKITARARWWFEQNPMTGEPQQMFVWDWHATTIQLLLSFATTDGKKTLFKSINQVVDLHSAKGQRVWSRTLGIPESDPQPYGVAGELLEHEHSDKMPELYKLLNITRRPVLNIGDSVTHLWAAKKAVLPTPVPPPYPKLIAPADEED